MWNFSALNSFNESNDTNWTNWTNWTNITTQTEEPTVGTCDRELGAWSEQVIVLELSTDALLLILPTFFYILLVEKNVRRVFHPYNHLLHEKPP